MLERSSIVKGLLSGRMEDILGYSHPAQRDPYMAKNTHKPSRPRYDLLQGVIAEGSAKAQLDVHGRSNALKQLEGVSGTRVVFYWSRLDRPLVRTDVMPIANMLQSVGRVNDLDFVIVSPGGDGTAAETIVDLCRKYCNSRFRVVVPAYAKSAATLIALSADEIVMGESSELGPIDAQVFVMQDGIEQQVSADHVIRARNTAVSNLGSANPAEVQAAQIQLSTLSAPFLQYCEDSMQFARDFAGKQLRAHMFSAEIAQDALTWGGKIDQLIANLTASSIHLSHGRMITAADMKTSAELNCLKVNELGADSPYWLAVSELLLRTEIIAQQSKIGKILYAKGFELFGA